MNSGNRNLLAWLNPDPKAGSRTAFKDALLGGGALPYAMIRAITFFVMMLSLVATLAGSHLNGEGLIIRFANEYERPLIGILIISTAILVLLCVTMWAVLASSGSFFAVVAAFLISACTLYEIGSLVKDTALYYVAPIVLGAVAINSVLLSFTSAKSEDVSCLLAAFLSSSVAVYVDISSAGIIFDRSNEIMLSVSRFGIFFIPFLFGVIAALAVSRWNLEQAKIGVGLVKASLPALICAVLVAGLVVAIVIFSALRKLLRVGFNGSKNP